MAAPHSYRACSPLLEVGGRTFARGAQADARTESAHGETVAARASLSFEKEIGGLIVLKARALARSRA